MSESFLVTGGAGFIGSHLVAALLERGDNVRVVDDFSTGKRENLEGFLDRIELIEGSLVEEEICRRAVEDVDFVLHEAALPSVARSVEDPVSTNRANVEGTVQLLAAAKDARVRRFVFAASSSAYGEVEAPAKSEHLLPQPLSPYAVAKLTGEYYCHAFNAVYGLETISLRYFNVFGPNQDPSSPYSAVIPIFVTAALDGRSPTIFGDGHQSRDFTYAANVVHANLLACRAPERAVGEVINVACGRSTDLLTLLAMIGRILGTTIEPQFAPLRPGDVRHSLADLAKARELLDYEPLVSVEEGLERTIEWYRSNRGRW
ncbi:Vi polysaccharide biosynthesis protein VipB/TviC [candidate division BRC1 bacterium SM23_51]|nr:MAG: Vi polysaccharide biosynthesis protein VipB/TviC [candidate division BRC1 bacterium SM23_51]